MTTEERLAELLLQWEVRWEHGEDLTAEQLCADQPDLVAPLQRRIDRLKRMAWMTEEEPPAEPSNAPADVLLGTTLADRYRLDALVGEGGFGRVYRAFDRELQRPVAVKLAHPDRSAPTNRGSLLDEARRAAKLRHPGIVAVHDLGQHAGALFLVSDLIDGTTLAQKIAAGPLPSREAAALVADLADALHFAHEHGFLHRDIKPANILIDGHGRALITDFGLATDTRQLSPGIRATSGTLPYMAPEQVAGEVQLIGPRTDIYALGVVLFELLTGRLPFQARTPTAMREQILFRPPPAVRARHPNVPEQMEALCLRCLAKHPADRFPSADAVAVALRSPASGRRPALLRGRALPALVLIGVFGAGVVVGTILPSLGSPTPAPVSMIHEAGVLHFDGTHRILTPLERFTPSTLEVWVQPKFYPKRDSQFFLGSDIPTRHGLSLGLSEAILCAEYIPGVIFSESAIPLDRFSHAAVVFGPTETRLYLGGRKVAVGPATQTTGGAPFVVGNVGSGNPINFFVGKIRAVRISRGERFSADFLPDETFVADAADTPTRAVLIYDGTPGPGDRVPDQSGAGNHGRWERVPLASPAP